MNIEIERRFLLKNDKWRESIKDSSHIRQGYLSNAECKSTTRVRLIDDDGVISIKGPKRPDGGRIEIETSINKQDALVLLASMCNSVLSKERYYIPHRHITNMSVNTRSVQTRPAASTMDLVWEIDEFYGANQGLIIAEIELPRADLELVLPDWIGEEITEDKKYSNYRLSLNK